MESIDDLVPVLENKRVYTVTTTQTSENSYWQCLGRFVVVGGCPPDEAPVETPPAFRDDDISISLEHEQYGCHAQDDPVVGGAAP